MLNPTVLLTIAFFVAFFSALVLHPQIVKVAKLKNITDNPDKRKLQREPVPVLGGIVVFFGIVMGAGLTSPYYVNTDIMLMFGLMLMMLYTGTLDDVLGLTAGIRIVIEILAAAILIFVGGYSIDNFHGLWGIYEISLWIGIPLTVVTVVGIINAINLIDGVNGLSSGYCIVACAIFGIYFYMANDIMMTVMAVTCIGALIPFFVHNVFGNSSRMFIGDGGTLMMGMILVMFVLRVLDSDHVYTANLIEDAAGAGRALGLIPFTLAVLSMPVFDTLRVMSRRIMRGTSPFQPDKTHLHHAFIALGFSHLATTLSIICFNLIIVIGWYAIYVYGGPIGFQLAFVICFVLLFTCGTYLIARRLTSQQ